jgi:hypothetical protein
VLIVDTVAAVVSISPACSDPLQGGYRFARGTGQRRCDPHHLRQHQCRSADIQLSSVHPHRYPSSMRGWTRGGAGPATAQRHWSAPFAIATMSFCNAMRVIVRAGPPGVPPCRRCRQCRRDARARHDPRHLASHGVIGIAGDEATARIWYQRAKELGSVGAERIPAKTFGK